MSNSLNQTAQPLSPAMKWALRLTSGLLAVVILLIWLSPEPPAKPAPELTPEQRVLAQFSKWDGSHTASVKAIKDAINDPDSFKHGETRYWERPDGFKVMTTFHARNGFGGMVKTRAVTVVDLSGHVLSLEFLQ